MFAAREGDFASAKLLVAAGANVNDVDAWGVSATVSRRSLRGIGSSSNFLLRRARIERGRGGFYGTP